MSVWMENLLGASRDAAVLALMIGLLLVLIGRYLPAGCRHGLWLLVAVRLMMPVLPESPLSMQQVLDAEESVIPVASELPSSEVPAFEPAVVIGEAFPEATSQSPAIGFEIPEAGQESARIGLWEVLFRVWISGVIAVVGLGAFFTLRFSGRLRRFSRTNPRQVEMENFLRKLGEDLGFGKTPRVKVTEAVDVPALYGLFRPVILVPPRVLEKLSRAELRLVLMHEMGHWRRRDLWVNFLLVFLQAVHWFNPMVWWAFHRARVESERATDAWVLRRAGAGENTNYGEMLLRLLDAAPKSRTIFSGVVSVVESPKDLKRRMKGIVNFSGKRNRLAVMGSVALLLILATVGLTQAPEREKDDVIAKPDSGEKAEAFTCMVIAEDGDSVEGAEVFLQASSNLSGDPMGGLISCGITDSEGHCKIPIKAEWMETTYTTIKLFARHPKAGYGGIYNSVPSPGATMAISLTLKQGLSFRILDEAGIPVSGLGLRVVRAEAPVYDDKNKPKLWGVLPPLAKGFWNGVTDKDGRCEIEGLAPGLYFVDHGDTRYGQIPGYYSGKIQYNPAEHVRDIEIRLQPASTVSGTVTLPDGQVAAGARVRINEVFGYPQGGLVAEAVADENGRYKLERLLAADYHLVVEFAGGLEKEWISGITELSLKAGEQRKNLDPVITKGALIKGKVVLADTGKGVRDLAIGIYPKMRTSPFGSLTAVTDDEGLFQVRARSGAVRVGVVGIPPEGYTRSIKDDGSTDAELEPKEDQASSVVLELQRDGIIRGVVLDEAGKPVVGANLACPVENIIRPGGNQKASDEQGRFSFYLPTGIDSALIIAEFKGMISDPIKKSEAGKEAQLIIRPNYLVNVKGRVLDTDNRPIEGAEVAWVSHQKFESIPIKVMTGSDGRFEAKVIPEEGLINFWGSKEGFGRGISQASVKDRQAVELEVIRLKPTNAMLRGTVVDIEGKPVMNAQVSANGNHQPDIPNVATDEAGKFVLEGMVDGWVNVQILNRDKLLPLRLRTGTDDKTIVFKGRHHRLVRREPIDWVGKVAPPLVGETWFNTEPLAAQAKGKVRLVSFVGIDRALNFHGNMIAALEKLREEIPDDDLEIILVHGNWPKQEVEEILENEFPDLKLPLAIEPETGAMSEAFAIGHWLTVVIDQTGNVAFQDTGKWGEAKKKVKILLGEDAGD